MEWLQLVPYFFGGVLLTNAVPHVISGVKGKPFQTPFAKPRGQGLSSSTVNVLWGFFNLFIGYVLIYRVGDFDLKRISDVIPFALGALVLSLFLARHFGRFNGGNTSEPS